MNTYDCILSRRSTRKFSGREIEEDKLQKLLNAGRYAPSGSNVQLNHFIVIKNQNVLNELAQLVRSIFLGSEVSENTPKAFARSVRAAQKESFNFYYGSPVLIIAANKTSNQNNMADVACALENIMLMANDLDLGSCWINQLKWLNERQELLSYLGTLGLQDDERPYGAVAVGYPADTEDGLPNRKDLARTGNQVTMIE